MNVGIVGLGLIGGSFARAYSSQGHGVLALEKDPAVLEKAMAERAVSGKLTGENVSRCDLVLICVYPEAAVSFLKEYGPRFGPHPVVIDCCGTKRKTVSAGMETAGRYGFHFLGGHPMAGTQYSGFDHSRGNLFHGAPMVIVPPENADPALIRRAEELLSPAGFGSVNLTTAEQHDRVIAFTSQLAHVVSNAYVKSPAALNHRGFSAGSYRDLTRVAWLNPQMWTELFLENRDDLTEEIDILIGHLQEYRDALAEQNRDRLTDLLADGKRRKEMLDSEEAAE